MRPDPAPSGSPGLARSRNGLDPYQQGTHCRLDLLQFCGREGEDPVVEDRGGIVVDTAAKRVASSGRVPDDRVSAGAQMMAQALGGKVYPGGRKEIGFDELVLSTEGQQSSLKHLSGVPVLHWHGDTFYLPPTATRLASTVVYENQAFSVGPNVLGLQFHPEALTRTFECWLIGHTAELNGAHQDIPRLRAQAHLHGDLLERAGRDMLNEWLQGVNWS